MSNDRAVAIIRKFDEAIRAAEPRTANRMIAALERAYDQLEREILKAYERHASDLSLLPLERKRLIMNADEVMRLLQLFEADSAPAIEAALQSLLEGTREDGAKIAADLVEAIADEKLQNFSGVPLRVVRTQAEEGARRLRNHSAQARSRISGIVEMGIASGHGTRKVARTMRSELGLLKGKAEMIARTEVLGSFGQSAIHNYRQNGINYWQRIGTQDDQICGYCLARHGYVYRSKQVAQVLLHPSDRCYPMPFKPEWVKAGLITKEWWQESRLKLRAAAEVQPNYGIAPFERAAKLGKAPEPFWKP